MDDPSLQERYAPTSICYGCGPANSRGLHIRSFVDGDEVIADWTPEPHHQAFPGILNGGVIGTLLDCHCNWTAAYHLMRQAGLDRPGCTVTAEYTIALTRPTPVTGPVHLRAHVVRASGDRALVEGTLEATGEDGESVVCATCSGLFVAVKPGHPAYHSW